MSEHDRAIDRWLKYVALLGPMISGVVFGIIGYIGGYSHVKTQLGFHADRIENLEVWRGKQEDLDQKMLIALTRVKALIKDTGQEP